VCLATEKLFSAINSQNMYTDGFYRTPFRLFFVDAAWLEFELSSVSKKKVGEYIVLEVVAHLKYLGKAHQQSIPMRNRLHSGVNFV
jgi:hypothetical protein